MKWLNSVYFLSIYMTPKRLSPFMEGEHTHYPTGPDGRLNVEGHDLPELGPEPPLTKDQEINRLYTKFGFNFHSDVYPISDIFLSFQAKRAVIGFILDFLKADSPLRIDEELQGSLDLNITWMAIEGDQVVFHGQVPLRLNFGAPLIMPYTGSISLDSVSDEDFAVIAGQEHLPVSLGIAGTVVAVVNSLREFNVSAVDQMLGEMSSVEARIEFERVMISPLSPETLEDMPSNEGDLYTGISSGEIPIPLVQIAGQNINVAWHVGDGKICSDLMAIVDPIVERLELRDSHIFQFSGVTLFAAGITKAEMAFDYHSWVGTVSECLSILLREKGVYVEIEVLALDGEGESGLPADYMFDIKVVAPDELD
jgi:hypothetical protein